MESSRSRAFAARVLIPLGLGLLLALALGTGRALADEVEHGDEQVTITVTINEYVPDDDGGLATTGAQIGVPLGAGILLTAVGAGAYAIARRRPAEG